MKIPVSERALSTRIRRALEKEGMTLRRARGTRALLDFGDWYVINTRMNAVVDKDIGLEDYGRELGVLKDFEELAED